MLRLLALLFLACLAAHGGGATRLHPRRSRPSRSARLADLTNRRCRQAEAAVGVLGKTATEVDPRSSRRCVRWRLRRKQAGKVQVVVAVRSPRGATGRSSRS